MTSVPRNQQPSNRSTELNNDTVGHISKFLPLQDVLAMRESNPAWRTALDEELSRRLAHIPLAAPVTYENSVRDAERAAQSAEARIARARLWGAHSRCLFASIGAVLAEATVLGVSLGAWILPALSGAHACAVAGCSNGAWQTNSYSGNVGYATSEANCMSFYDVSSLVSDTDLDPCAASDGSKLLAGILISSFGSVGIPLVASVLAARLAPSLSVAAASVGNRLLWIKDQLAGDSTAAAEAPDTTVEDRLRAARKLTAHLLQAVTVGDNTAVAKLMGLGAPTSLRDPTTGKTPVSAAIETNHASILATLLRGGHLPTAQELGTAVQRQNLGAIRALLDKAGGDAATLINSTVPGLGGTPFHLSVYAPSTEVFSLFANNGGDLACLNEDGLSVEILAKARPDLRPVLDGLPRSTVIEMTAG